jgi:ankyrin repeat protein
MGATIVRPLVAALAGEHFQTADLLRHNGADLNVQGQDGRIPLHAAAFSGNLEMVRILIEYNPADINARDSGPGGRRYFGHQEAIITMTVLSESITARVWCRYKCTGSDTAGPHCTLGFVQWGAGGCAPAARIWR